MINSKNKKCIECGREDQPHFSRKRCKGCAQKGYANKSQEKAFTISSSPPKKKTNKDTKYKQIYFDYFGYTEGDFIPCEICGKEAVDIHHIDARGMGGDPTKSKENIENLMALCREDHETYGDITEYKGLLKLIHKKKLTLP